MKLLLRLALGESQPIYQEVEVNNTLWQYKPTSHLYLVNKDLETLKYEGAKIEIGTSEPQRYLSDMILWNAPYNISDKTDEELEKLFQSKIPSWIVVNFKDQDFSEMFEIIGTGLNTSIFLGHFDNSQNFVGDIKSYLKKEIYEFNATSLKEKKKDPNHFDVYIDNQAIDYLRSRLVHKPPFVFPQDNNESFFISSNTLFGLKIF